MFVLANMWFQTLMRQFFFNIDKIVYNFISIIYDLLITIARTSVLSQADIMLMADRIYKLLAVFMVFKVTFSLIMYVVNPDDFSDKSKGVGKLGTNIVMALLLLILTPYIFNYAYSFQTIILEDNSLSALIFGDDQNNYDAFDTAGDKMAYMTMLPFFSPNLGISELYECAQLTTGVDGTTNRSIFNKDCSGMTEDLGDAGDDESLYALINPRFSEKDLKNYVTGVEIGNFGLMFRQDIAVATAHDNSEYVIEYRYIFSTVVGVIIVLLLISFCLDVALRSIKLAMLQLVAPIPIISYVDPKSGKDGLFKKWYQMCFKTYISLFIRLLAVYFAVFIISKLDRMVDIVNGAYVNNLYVKIFIIIGVLMFAKQLPKILEGLGIKLDGDGKFMLNPLKKFEEQAIGGKNITGMARGAMVGTAGMLTGAGFAAGLSGAWRGLRSGKGWSDAGKTTAEMNRKMRQAKLNGSTFAGRMGARVTAATGLRSQSESITKEKNELQKHIDEAKNAKEKIEANIAPDRTAISRGEATSSAITAMQDRAYNKLLEGKGTAGAQYQRMMQNQEVLKTRADALAAKAGQTGSASDLAAAEAAAKALKMQQQADDKWAHTTGRDLLINEFMAGGVDDKFDDLKSAYETAAKTSGHTVQTTAAALDAQNTSIGHTVQTIKTKISDDERKIAGYDDQIKDYNAKMQDINKREKKANANEDAIK